MTRRSRPFTSIDISLSISLKPQRLKFGPGRLDRITLPDTVNVVYGERRKRLRADDAGRRKMPWEDIVRWSELDDGTYGI